MDPEEKEGTLPVKAQTQALETKLFPKLAELAPEDQEVFQSLLKLIALGFQRDKLYPQVIKAAKKTQFANTYVSSRLFFRDVREDLAFFGEFLTAQDGYVEEGQVFATTRDGWAKGLPAPSMKGVYREDQAQIELSCNFAWRNPYQYRVLPGTNTVVIKQDGTIEKLSAPGEWEPLSLAEKKELTKMFDQLGSKIQRIHEADRQFLEELRGSSSQSSQRT